MKDACLGPDPFACEASLVDKDCATAIDWMHSVGPAVAMREREKMTKKVEGLGRVLRERGETAAWLSEGDEHAQAMSKNVNGPLAIHLAKLTGFTNIDVVDSLRFGGQIAGVLPTSGDGTPFVYPKHWDIEELAAKCGEQNRETIKALRQGRSAYVFRFK